MLKLKKGVDINNTCGEMFDAAIVVNEVLSIHGIKECWITSGQDGKHGVGSLHGKGKALDFRTRDWPPKKVKAIVSLIEGDLKLTGAWYDVVLESDHLHIEWDKKK
jgi:hypothetical protein